MNKFYTASILSFMMMSSLLAQVPFTEFDAPTHQVDNLQSFVAKNTIFLFYNAHGSSGTDTKNVNVISEKGTNHDYAINIPAKALVCGVLKYDSGFHFYYLLGSRKELALNCLSFNAETGVDKVINEELKIEGTLVGSWSTDSLSLAIYNKDKNQLKVVHLQDFQLVDEKVFDLPVDLKSDYKDITFIPENAMLSVEAGTAKYKLYKQKNFLVISIDHAFLESLNKIETEVVKLNLNDGSQAYYEIKNNSNGNFRSFVYDDKLYRSTISKNKFELDVITLADTSLISHKEIIRDTSLQKTASYFRYSKTNHISKNDNLYQLMNISNLSESSVAVHKDPTSTQIIWGTYYDKRSNSVAGSPLAMFSTFIILTAIREMSKPQGISRYLYYTADSNYEIKPTPESNPSATEAIDNYEIAMEKKKVGYRYKSCFPYQGNVMALYLDHHTNKFKLIRF